MTELHEKLYDITDEINLINATLEFIKEKQFYYLREENMYLAHHFANEHLRLSELLDKRYKEQEKIYHELLVEVL